MNLFIAKLQLFVFQIRTIDEYARSNLKYFQRRWYADHIVVYPNRRSKNIITIVSKISLQ